MMSWGCTSPHRRASASSTRSCPRSIPGMPGCKSSDPTDRSKFRGRIGSRSCSRNPMRSVQGWHRCSWTGPSGSARSPVSIESDSMHPARSSSPLGCLGSPWRSWMMSWGCTSPHRRASASSTRSCQRSALHWRWCKRTVPSCCSRCPSRRASASSIRSCPRSIPGMPGCRRTVPSCCSRCPSRRGSASSTRSCPRSIPHWRSCSLPARTGLARSRWSMSWVPVPRARSSSPLGCLGSPWRSWMMSWGCTSPHRRASASSTRSCPRSARGCRWCRRTVPSCCSRCPSRRGSGRRSVRVHVVPNARVHAPGLPGLVCHVPMEHGVWAIDPFVST